MNETENQTRLLRAKDALEIARESEARHRHILLGCVESTKRAKDRLEELLLAEEKAEATRRRQA